jgi:hypothetical protein
MAEVEEDFVGKLLDSPTNAALARKIYRGEDSREKQAGDCSGEKAPYEPPRSFSSSLGRQNCWADHRQKRNRVSTSDFDKLRPGVAAFV